MTELEETLKAIDALPEGQTVYFYQSNPDDPFDGAYAVTGLTTDNFLNYWPTPTAR